MAIELRADDGDLPAGCALRLVTDDACDPTCGSASAPIESRSSYVFSFYCFDEQALIVDNNRHGANLRDTRS